MSIPPPPTAHRLFPSPPHTTCISLPPQRPYHPHPAKHVLLPHQGPELKLQRLKLPSSLAPLRSYIPLETMGFLKTVLHRPLRLRTYMYPPIPLRCKYLYSFTLRQRGLDPEALNANLYGNHETKKWTEERDVKGEDEIDWITMRRKRRGEAAEKKTEVPESAEKSPEAVEAERKEQWEEKKFDKLVELFQKDMADHTAAKGEEVGEGVSDKPVKASAPKDEPASQRRPTSDLKNDSIIIISPPKSPPASQSGPTSNLKNGIIKTSPAKFPPAPQSKPTSNLKHDSIKTSPPKSPPAASKAPDLKHSPPTPSEPDVCNFHQTRSSKNPLVISSTPLPADRATLDCLRHLLARQPPHTPAIQVFPTKLPRPKPPLPSKSTNPAKPSPLQPESSKSQASRPTLSSAATNKLLNSVNLDPATLALHSPHTGYTASPPRKSPEFKSQPTAEDADTWHGLDSAEHPPFRTSAPETVWHGFEFNVSPELISTSSSASGLGNIHQPLSPASGVFINSDADWTELYYDRRRRGHEMPDITGRKERDEEPVSKHTIPQYRVLSAAEEIARNRWRRASRIRRRRRIVGPVPESVKAEKVETKGEKGGSERGVLGRMFWGGLWVGGLTGLVSLGAN